MSGQEDFGALNEDEYGGEDQPAIVGDYDDDGEDAYQDQGWGEGSF
jgi:hypothetical protein